MLETSELMFIKCGPWKGIKAGCDEENHSIQLADAN